MSQATRIFTPEDGADQTGGLPKRDKAMLGVLMAALAPDVDEPNQPPGDFEAAWRGLDCDHKNVSCQALGRIVSLGCIGRPRPVPAVTVHPGSTRRLHAGGTLAPRFVRPRQAPDGACTAAL